ncbi:hypothetical protein A7979_03990 [Rothia nasimurium]|uniref:Threonine/serine exporter family protein n=1 Tax=Rothia nasimurium TaxID=85336 RepID=A0A1Y1RNS1_9MICC|nr:threonine/serine exporter family protein [Rothia nasimurium]ORC16487.1 hypothetical protein A7979_03990 [Rothia nasimurium]
MTDSSRRGLGSEPHPEPETTPFSAQPLPQASYPATVPVTQPPAKRRAGASLRSFAQPQQALTVPMRGIARVAQRQLAQVAVARYRQRAQHKEHTREILAFALRLAETLFHYGADAADVDAAVVTVCAVYGLHDVEVDITYQSIVINYVSEFDRAAQAGTLPEAMTTTQGVAGQDPAGGEKLGLTLVRVVRSTSENYRALHRLYTLVHDIASGQVSRIRAERRLATINSEKKPYSPAALLAWNLIMAGAFTLGVGGSWRAALTSLVVYTAVHGVLAAADKLALPSFFMMALGSGVITMLALFVSSPGGYLVARGFYVSAPHVVAAGLMMLLPTFRLVSAVQDALHGFPLTAAGKFVITGANFTGLIAGIAVALTVVNFFDPASFNVQATVFNPPPLWGTIAGMAVGSAMTAAAWQGSATNIWLAAFVSLAGQATYHGLNLGSGLEAGRLNVLIGAFTVGLLSALAGYLLHAPASTYYVPGMMFMLPGLTIFRSSYLVLGGEDLSAGIQGLTAAGVTVLLMATGIVLGTYLWDAVTQKVRSARAPS